MIDDNIMQSILIIFLIIAVIFFLSYFTSSPTQLTNERENSQQKTLIEAQQNPAVSKLNIEDLNGAAAMIKPENSALVDTYITAGPEEESILETDRTTFEFEGKIFPENTAKQVYFETKVGGIDDDWIKTYSKKRTIIFPSTPKEYTFSVRAVINNSVDPTPATRTFRINISPYFSKVNISNVTIPSSSSPSKITLKTNLKEKERINITGWQIQGREGSATIPQGIEVYITGYSYADNDIFVKQGDTIYLSGGSNPLGRNKSFRLNKCFGYFAKTQKFTTPVSTSCPKPKKEEISHLSPCCQNFILSRIQGCNVPDYSRNWEIVYDSQCVSFITENFNYDGCFRKYSGDEDFLKNEWHIYLESEVATDRYCDTIYLRDKDGLLVDSYSYGRSVCK